MRYKIIKYTQNDGLTYFEAYYKTFWGWKQYNNGFSFDTRERALDYIDRQHATKIKSIEVEYINK